MRVNLVPRSFVMSVWVLFGASCGGSESPKSPTSPDIEQVASVAVSASSTTLASGATIQLTVSVTGTKGSSMTGSQITWSTSNEAVATVSNNGTVTAQSVLGGASLPVTVTASTGGRSGSVTLQVLPVPAESLALPMGSFAIATGDVRQLRLDVTDAAGRILTGRSASWFSSDAAVVTVTEQGLITALADGSAQVTVSVEGISTSVEVTSVETDTYSIPVDLASASYPWDYYTPTSAAAGVSADPCSLNNSVLQVPRSYLGANPLPEANGAPLDPGIKRGIAHKDVWLIGNPSFADGCAGDVRSEFLRTLDRLVVLGADYVSLTPWTFIEINSGNWSIMDPDDVESSILGDVDFAWAVQQAHARGLEVHWINQIQGAVVDGEGQVPDATRENVATFMEAYEPYMLERAAFLEANGVDAMLVSCICWTWLEEASLTDLYIPAIEALLPKIKAVFSGALRMNAHPSVVTSAALKSGIDYIQLSFGFGSDGLAAEGLTVGALKSGYASALAGEAGLYAAAGKPVIFEMDAASRSRVFTTGYMEETFCTGGFHDIFASDSECIQRLADTDFSIQAMAYQAYLEVIQEQSMMTTYAVENSGYWMVDQLTPSSTFPNIAVSARNKPSEALLRIWFAR